MKTFLQHLIESHNVIGIKINPELKKSYNPQKRGVRVFFRRRV